ncbi:MULTISPECIES: hypothetical protein [Pseudoalteromonas]|uniref:hypothetical protein n=1 Tax=Pseudoalteromonas TaxID=53246 RepID=UPI00026CBB4D|nr:hypothetical protein [Pseudoalteromonas spongiae]
MTIAIRTLIFILIICCTAFVYSAIHNRDVHLSHFDFLTSHQILSVKEKPEVKHWYFTAYPNNNYHYGLSNNEVIEGKSSLFIVNKLPSKDGAASIRQTIQAASFKNQKIELSGYVKASNLDGEITLQLDMLDHDDNIVRRADAKFIGTNTELDWQRFSIVAQVPADSSALSYAGILRGSGQVWFDKFELKLAPNEAKDNSYAYGYTMPKEEAPSPARTRYLNIVGYNTQPFGTLTKGAQPINHSTWEISDELDGEYQISNDTGTLLLESIVDEPNFGVVLKRFDFNAANAIKENITGIRFRAQIKHQFVKSIASIWMRIEDKHTNALAFDNLRYTSGGGTRDWQDIEVTLPITENAAIVSFGALLISRGKLWLRNPHIEYVHEPVQRNTQLLAKPSNLGFE